MIFFTFILMHTVIGNFYKCTHPLIKVKDSSPVTLDLWKILTISIYSYFSRNMLIQHDDIELNPVLAKNTDIWHLSLKCKQSYCSQDAKNLIDRVYNTNHKYDFICISETYWDSTVAWDDKDLVIEGYNLVYGDHPSNLKKGGVCFYYKDSLAV